MQPGRKPTIESSKVLPGEHISYSSFCPRRGVKIKKAVAMKYTLLPDLPKICLIVAPHLGDPGLQTITSAESMAVASFRIVTRHRFFCANHCDYCVLNSRRFQGIFSGNACSFWRSLTTKYLARIFTRRIQLTLSIMLALSLLAAVLAVALLRERRLRLALEALVSKLAWWP